MTRSRLVSAVVVLLLLAACGTDPKVSALGNRLGCRSIRENGQVVMNGRGLVAWCDGLPELASDDHALLFWFRSQSTRNDFFTNSWPKQKFCGTAVVMGDDWALTFDNGPGIVEKESHLITRTGGQDMTSTGVFPGCATR